MGLKTGNSTNFIKEDITTFRASDIHILMSIHDLEIHGADTKHLLNWVSCYLRCDLPKPVTCQWEAFISCCLLTISSRAKANGQLLES